MTNPLGRQTSIGIVWSGMGRYTNQILNLVTSAILARILSPSDFGIVAMVLVFTGFVAVFSDAGIRSAVVQFKDLSRKELSTIFWIGLMIGCILTVLIVSLSPLIAKFYHSPKLVSVVSAMSITFFLSSLGIVPGGLLQRDMRFKALSLSSITAALIAGAVAVSLALLGAGYWALVAQSIINVTLLAFILFFTAKWHPFLEFDSKVIRRLVSFSGNFTLFNIINYWSRSADNLIVGWCFGPAALGYYSRAYQLMLYPMNALTTVINPVLHPSLANMQNDRKRLYRAYLRVLKFIAMISVPMMTAIGLMATECVTTLWGTQWTESIPIFRILAIVGAIQPVYSSSGGVFLACNRTDLLFKVGCFYSLSLIAGIAVGSLWGVKGVAWGYAIAYILIFLPCNYVVFKKLLPGKMSDFFRIMAHPFEVALVVAIVVSSWNYLAPIGMMPPLHLVIGLLGALLAFIGAVYFLDRSFFREYQAIIGSLVRRTR